MNISMYNYVTGELISEEYDSFFPRQYEYELQEHEAIALKYGITKQRESKTYDGIFRPIVINNTLFFFNTNMCKWLIEDAICNACGECTNQGIGILFLLDLKRTILFISRNKINFKEFYYKNICSRCNEVYIDINFHKNNLCRKCIDSDKKEISNKKSIIRKNTYNKIRKAMRDGILIKINTCEACDKKCITDSHHWNGYNNPLDVMWLCKNCHGVAEKFKNMSKDKIIECIKSDTEWCKRANERIDKIKVY